MSSNQMKPLAERMRPQTLEAVAGQAHLVQKGAVLYKMLAIGKIPSIIFWGPPGVGKTTLARIIAEKSNLQFFSLSAIDSGVKEVRSVIEAAGKLGKALLFIDEIHRFNKSQQDSLLGAIEKGIITLIGATTENPSFEVNAALLSRCQVYVLKSLEIEDLRHLYKTCLAEDEVLQQKKITIKEDDALLYFSGGDARKLLNLLELVVHSLAQNDIEIDNAKVTEIIQSRQATYDKKGEMHYDVISAFIKSIRGSDPNAALYYLARMMQAGEDPKFIARRMLILSSEDIGNANPTALVMANNCFQAVNIIGYPECDLILAQTVIYLATSAKSNASYKAIREAQKAATMSGDQPISLHLRNAPNKLMKQLNYGKEYKYAHEFEGNFVEIEFLPEQLSGSVFYQPGDNPREQEIRNQLRKWWKAKYNY